MSDWSVSAFEMRRPGLCDFLRRGPIFALEQGCRRIIVRAPVKSGKRSMPEYMVRRDSAANPSRMHCFVSAWNRVADKSQHEELTAYGLKVFIGINATKAIACIDWINGQVAAGKQVVVHLDECDHGSGEKQTLSKIWKAIRDNTNVAVILYSATPQEVLFSGEVDDPEHTEMVEELMDDGQVFHYTPPDTFRGPKAFLEAGLVHEAKPFFCHTAQGFSLSEQGKSIVADLRVAMSTSRRNVLVLRLSYMEVSGAAAARKENKSIYRFLRNIDEFPELADFLVIVDKSESVGRNSRIFQEQIDWSNPHWWAAKTDTRPLLVVCDQTSSRSTEWSCHDRVFAYHDYRNQLSFSVVSQAQERVNHFIGEKYTEFQPIRVYGSVKTWKLSAGEIDYKVFLTHEWKMRKVDRRRRPDDVYEIKNSVTDALHPAHTEPMSYDVANQILQNLGCAAAISLSARVCGSVRPVADVEDTFIPCTPESFNELRAAGQMGKPTCDNPFIESERRGLVNGRYTGIIRGVPGVYTMQQAIDSGGVNKGNRERRVICYNDDVLGVLLKVYCGVKMMDTLTAYKSMYGERRTE